METTTNSLDLTGFNLGEKKIIRDSYGKVFPDASKLITNYGPTFTIDALTFEKYTKDTEERKWIGGVAFERYVPELTSTIEKFCSKDPEYAQAFKQTVKEIIYQGGCHDKGKEKATFELKDGRLLIKLNCAYFGYSLDWDGLISMLEKSVSTENSNDAFDLSGYNLGEKKSIKDSHAKMYPDAAKIITSCGAIFTIDYQSFEKYTRDTEERKWIGVVALERYLPELSSTIEKFCRKDPDYLEAFKEGVKEVIYQGGCYDKGKEKLTFDLKDKKLMIKLNCAYICYSMDWDNLITFLEKSF